MKHFTYRPLLDRAVVTAEQMRRIEERIFAAGMPVAALMEKVAGLIAARVQALYPPATVGIPIGPGHNGGDAAVVARELHLQGYCVRLYRPFPKLKELTAAHFNYACSLGVPVVESIAELADCEFIVDGLFGFGLERTLSGKIAEEIATLNSWQKPVVSIDLPSGIHTDTGEVLGVAVRATQTFCLGLWKRATLQDAALEYCGEVSRVDFGIPVADIEAILSPAPEVQRLTLEVARAQLPLPRPAVTHKYKQGHLLLVCGSQRYAGGAILTALGARGSGVGMLSVAVPESLKLMVVAQVPEALVVGCPETETGAIAQLPDLDLSQFSAIAGGPGLTLEALPVVERLLNAPVPLILDADGLNALAQWGTVTALSQRSQPTLLTPHAGEFKRLFPEIDLRDRINAVREAAAACRAIVLLKGAKTAIANPQGQVWLIPESTPALARGGSGDVLAGLMGGLVAQQGATHTVAAVAAWWHARAGVLAARERSELGVDAFTLAQILTRVLI